jgi:hypothetical protein
MCFRECRHSHCFINQKHHSLRNRSQFLIKISPSCVPRFWPWNQSLSSLCVHMNLNFIKSWKNVIYEAHFHGRINREQKVNVTFRLVKDFNFTGLHSIILQFPRISCVFVLSFQNKSIHRIIDVSFNGTNGKPNNMKLSWSVKSILTLEMIALRDIEPYLGGISDIGKLLTYWHLNPSWLIFSVYKPHAFTHPFTSPSLILGLQNKTKSFFELSIFRFLMTKRVQ